MVRAIIPAFNDKPGSFVVDIPKEHFSYDLLAKVANSVTGMSGSTVTLPPGSDLRYEGPR